MLINLQSSIDLYWLVFLLLSFDRTLSLFWYFQRHWIQFLVLNALFPTMNFLYCMLKSLLAMCKDPIWRKGQIDQKLTREVPVSGLWLGLNWWNAHQSHRSRLLRSSSWGTAKSQRKTRIWVLVKSWASTCYTYIYFALWSITLYCTNYFWQSSQWQEEWSGWQGSQKSDLKLWPNCRGKSIGTHSHSWVKWRSSLCLFLAIKFPNFARAAKVQKMP